MSSPPRALLRPPETQKDIDGPPSQFCAMNMPISTVFHPDALLDPSCTPDLVVLSADCMLFYAHSKILLYISRNSFSGLLPAAPCTELGLSEPVLRVQNDSTVLDLILHAIYGLDMIARYPFLAQLSLAVDSLLGCYAVPPPLVLSPGLPLFEAILAHAVMRPLSVYILAAHYDVDALAVASSAHMLSFPLTLLTDDDARAMGGVYLRRLFCLHFDRVEALRSLLLVLPAAHAPSAQCDGVSEQPKIQRAWALAIAAIVLNARPDTSQHALEAALGPLLTHVLCTDCRRMISNCTQNLVTRWSAVKRTI